MDATAEQIAFTMHPELLRSVIKKQAGSPDKAVLEGVMNSVDAGATSVAVTLDFERIKIVDNGGGFPTRDYIENFFKQFGTPHEDGDATYGKFRMGRGQMFAFGRNEWRSGKFQMNVDIDKTLGFDLLENQPNFDGCSITIDLYEPLTQRDLHAIGQELRKMVKYVSIPVTLNGEVISEDPAKGKFPDSTDDAYIKINEASSELRVYNLGVYVQSFYTHHFGVGGTVVSKKQLDVNFARNQVLASCKVWKRIKAEIDQNGETRVKRKQTLSDGEIESVIARLIDGTARAWEFRGARIFKDIAGRAWSAQQIIAGKFECFTTARKYDSLGDKLMQRGDVIVLDEDWVDKFEVKPAELFVKFHFLKHGEVAPRFAEFSNLTRNMNTSYISLPPEKWTPKERVWVDLLNYVLHELRSFTWRKHEVQKRDVRIGISSTAKAWTDGSTYVTFDRRYLAGLTLISHSAPFPRDIMDAILVECHEMCHNTDSRENVHSPEFYQAYHDMTIEVAPILLSRALGYMTAQRYKASIEKYSKKVKAPALLVQDAEAEAELIAANEG